MSKISKHTFLSMLNYRRIEEITSMFFTNTWRYTAQLQMKPK